MKYFYSIVLTFLIAFGIYGQYVFIKCDKVQKSLRKEINEQFKISNDCLKFYGRSDDSYYNCAMPPLKEVIRLMKEEKQRLKEQGCR